MSKLLLNPRIPLSGLIVAIVLFPVAAWLDFAQLINRELSSQATLMNQMVNETRQLYNDTLSVSLAMHPFPTIGGSTGPLRFGAFTSPNEEFTNLWSNRETNPYGPFPVPASFSIQLADRLSKAASNARFQFISDHPFTTRPAPPLTAEQHRILDGMRKADGAPAAQFTGGSLLHPGMTLYSPIVMQMNCVDCHNRHEASTKKDWKIGDVRGLQVVDLRPAKASVFTLKRHMIADFAVLIFFCGWLFTTQNRQTRIVAEANDELNQSRNYLRKLSSQLSKYIPPQIHRALVERRFDVAVSTERKKLTILFADIVDFTSMSERLQPEELTQVLNLYFDELSQIAEKHGGTVNKFIGDALLVFFGHPESGGERADAAACFAAAREMLAALPELGDRIRRTTPSVELRLRIGINTGVANVGNFGSSQRLDYTVIGAEVNVAARVIKTARPNTIALTDETFACLDAGGHFEKLPPQTCKGVSREVGVYLFDELAGHPQSEDKFALKAEGLDLSVDAEASDLRDLRAAQTRLSEIIRRRERAES
jgi:adenylate cyclase